MRETMQQLRFLVKDYRDKRIAHLRNPRATRGTQIAADGSTQMSVGVFYPTDRDVSTVSPNLDEVSKLIATYMEQLVTLVETNRERARYRLLTAR
jgi:hypothetical protein